ncbi:MAG: ankyrin repeat domain-containing protein, partial [Planctomycetota bacterium]
VQREPTAYRNYLPLEEVTIAEALKEAGYATAFMGKWHLAPPKTENASDYYPDHQGFDINIGGDYSGAPPTYFHPYSKKNRSLETMPPGGNEGEYLTDRLTDEAVKFIEANKNNPFMLYLSHYAVHFPLESKEELTKKYEEKAKTLPTHLGPLFAPVDDPCRVRQIQNHPVYAGMVQSVDESVGKILTRLETLSLERSTVVIFTSDNGGESTHAYQGPTSTLPLRAGKEWLYEGGIRVPMVIKWPGKAKPGAVCHEPVISTDFYPTMLEMAGLPLKPQQHTDGMSLVPLLMGAGRSARKAIYWYYPHYNTQGGNPCGAVRAGDYKLIEWHEDNRIELYNLKEDIGEKTDLTSKMSEKATELRRMLHRWLQAIDVPDIYLAAFIGNLAKLKAFIREGVDVNALDTEGCTALHYAANTSVAELLIARGARSNISGNWTPLHAAARRRHTDVAECLIANGANVNAGDDWFPLHSAINSSKQMVELLIAKGANIDAKDASGQTALHYAARDGHKEIVEVLLTHGADVDIGEKYYNRTAAEFAMWRNHNEVAELLIANGADISPLHFALHLNDQAKARRLIEGGAEVNRRTPYGTTPLSMAAGAGFTNIARLLISKGADVNAKDNWDWTPLHGAAGDGHKELVELLVLKEADVNAKDGDGRTPLWYAQQEGHTEVVELLQKHGAKE